jgi:hypothetical protein
MSIAIAHMSIEIIKQQQRDLIAARADKRANELDSIRKVILRKRIQDQTNLIEFFFSFQVFLAGAFISALYYA